MTTYWEKCSFLLDKPEKIQRINAVDVYVQLENIPEVTAESTLDDLWTAQMLSFIHQARATLKFAKKIPGECHVIGYMRYTFSLSLSPVNQ